MAYIKNDTGGTKTWVGQQILAGAYYQIQTSEHNQWENDSTLLIAIGNGDAVVAEDSSGNKDFSDIADGINFLKGITVEIKRNLGWEYALESLKESGGSQEMDVDGSTASVPFEWEVPSGEVWELLSISFFVLDPGTMSHNVFGALGSALTNGITVAVKKDGNTMKIKDIKDNVDLYMSFPAEQQVGNSASGFLDDDDYFSGCLRFPDPVELVGDDGDLVRVSVKDDLQNIKRLRTTILVRKKI